MSFGLVPPIAPDGMQHPVEPPGRLHRSPPPPRRPAWWRAWLGLVRRA